MILSMELGGILERIEQRLRELGISAREVARRAGKPRVVQNIRDAVKRGSPGGVSTTTLTALAAALECRQEWLLTGEGPMNLDKIAEYGLTGEEALALLTWLFQAGGAPEQEARVAARSVLRAFRTVEDQEGAPLSLESRHQLVETAIRLFGP